jgi:lipopolysaccharide transport system permease protein
MTQMSVSVSPSDRPAPPVAKPADAPQELIIQARRGFIGVDWAELLRFRELLAFLVWRDVKVKYKQAVLGVAWAVFVPLLSMVIYTVVGHFAGFDNKVSHNPAGQVIPYAVYIFAGIIPWTFLSQCISAGGSSLINQQPLMSKIYLPRLFIPSATVGGSLVDMLLSMSVFVGVLAYYAFVPSWKIVLLPLLIVLQIIAGLGLAILLSALTVMYRDLRFLLPFITQIGIWLSAVVFPQAILNRYQNWLALNPLAGIISGWRSLVLGLPLNHWQLLGSCVMCPIILVVGLFYFRRVERRFADIA